MSRIRVLPFAALLALAIAGCGEASLQQFEPPPEQPPVTDFTLTTGVAPLVTDKGCTSCHNATLFNSQLDLDVGPAQLRLNLLAGGAKEAASYGQDINVDFPEQSLLVLAPLTGSSFGQHAKYFGDTNDPGYQTWLGWIENGALED